MLGKEMLTMSREEFEHLMFEGFYGICLDCGSVAMEVEPDAIDYKCQVCGAYSVVGLELAVISGFIELKEK
jgi:hypothetical protein